MKNSMYVPRATDFSITRVFHQNRQILACACLLAALLLFPCAASWAYGGMTGGDGLPTEADCRSCHDDLIRFPFLGETNVDKHHPLIGSQIILTTAPPGVEVGPGETYDCFFCHSVDWGPETYSYTLSPFRDCLVCHPVETVSGPPQMRGDNRHHKLGYRCSVCHDQRR